MNKLISHAAALILGMAIIAGYSAYLKMKAPLTATLLQPAGELAGAKTDTLKCKDVIVYLDAVEKKLGLPDIVKRDASKHVVNAAKVPPSDYPQTMTAVYDDRTGGVDMFRRQDPLPWLAFNRRGAIGAAYGFKGGGNGFVTRLYGRIDLLQVKMLHAGLLGDVDNSGGWYGGAFVEGRW